MKRTLFKLPKKCSKKMSSFILCMVLIVAIALCTSGCNDHAKNQTSVTSNPQTDTQADTTILGEGSTHFLFSVVDREGNETIFEIHTDKANVGEALTELELIAGDEGPYGLFVKTVNGITADYETDGVYWAFYIDGDYATSSVDTTPITEGQTYSFRVE